MKTRQYHLELLLLLALFAGELCALQSPSVQDGTTCRTRRSLLLAPAAVSSVATLPASAATSNGLPLTTAPLSGLRWADAKVGTGQPLSLGTTASIDYSMASTAGRFPLIYTTKDKGAPYRWKLGDGSTIAGIEMAILGDEKDGIPPLLPGGIRRVVIPANLGFQALTKEPNVSKCEAGKVGSIGPIPPKDDLGAYQRWVQFYCNPRIPYQPDLVLDVKLYGKR
jgi:FKBP-type peptidyl-prolyl cis-trans isomerase